MTAPSSNGEMRYGWNHSAHSSQIGFHISPPRRINVASSCPHWSHSMGWIIRGAGR